MSPMYNNDFNNNLPAPSGRRGGKGHIEHYLWPPTLTFWTFSSNLSTKLLPRLKSLINAYRVPFNIFLNFHSQIACILFFLFKTPLTNLCYTYCTPFLLCYFCRKTWFVFFYFLDILKGKFIFEKKGKKM